MNEYPIPDYQTINPDMHILWHEVDTLFGKVTKQKADADKLAARVDTVEKILADHQMKITLLESQLRNGLQLIDQVAENVPNKNDYDE